MKENENTRENIAFTETDFKEFLSATGEEQWKILLAHAEKNKQLIKINRLKTTQKQINRKRND